MTTILSQSFALFKTWEAIAAAVGKLSGVVMFVMAFYIKSGRGLDNAIDPLSPITNTL